MRSLIDLRLEVAQRESRILFLPALQFRVDPLRSQTGLDRVDVIDRMVDSFRNRYGLAPGTIDAATVDRASDLVATKFGTEEWLTRVP